MTEKIREHLGKIVQAADGRMAKDIVALKVDQVTPLADYFVIMNANNQRQLDAIVDAVVDAAKEAGMEIKDVEGKRSGRWILIDLIDIIVHIFHYEDRSHYNLENIWQDAPLVDLSEWIHVE